MSQSEFQNTTNIRTQFEYWLTFFEKELSKSEKEILWQTYLAGVFAVYSSLSNMSGDVNEVIKKTDEYRAYLESVFSSNLERLGA